MRATRALTGPGRDAPMRHAARPASHGRPPATRSHARSGRDRPVRAPGVASGGTPAASSAPCTGSGRRGSRFLRDEMVRHFAAAERGHAAARRPARARRRLRRRADLRAAGAPRRAGDGARPGDREHRGGAPACGRPGPRHRLPRRHASRTWRREGRRSTPSCAWRWSSTCPTSAAFLKACAALVRPGRTDAAVDPQPHA